ncbi:putative reverse transcriptase domain-containing protein [Tanacetum coccineum]
MLHGLILQGLGRRNHTEDLNLYAPNATTIMMGSVLLNAPTVRGLVIRPRIVKVKLLPPTTKDPKGQIKEFSLALWGSGAYAVGTAETNPNSNVVTGTFLLNNRYASILFDTGADRSFVSTAFSSLIGIIPTILDYGYDVELADQLGSFDVIIGMDWLSKYQAVIVCAEKIVRIPFENEILLVRGDGSSLEHGKAERQVGMRRKRLEDVPIVRDFPEVFPKDFLGIPPTRQVEFQIDVYNCAALCRHKHLYRLAPSADKKNFGYNYKTF